MYIIKYIGSVLRWNPHAVELEGQWTVNIEIIYGVTCSIRDYVTFESKILSLYLVSRNVDIKICGNRILSVIFCVCV